MDAYPFMDHWLGQCCWMGKNAPSAQHLRYNRTDCRQVALVATGGLLGSELIIGVISLMHPVSL